MVEKIVIIHETFFRQHRDMGIELLREKGLEVELWSLYYVKYRKQEKISLPTDCRKDRVVYLQSYFEIICRILKEKSSNTIYFFTTTLHMNGVEDFTRTIIGATKQKYCNFIYEVCPIGHIRRDDMEIKDAWGKICEKMREYKGMMYRRIRHYIFPSLYTFIPTHYSCLNILPSWEYNKAIAIHNKDYDDYILAKREKQVICTKRYIVYIDDDLCDAEDFRKSGKKPIYNNEKNFYNNINRTFDKIEKYYDMGIIIAAHPKAEYQGEEFGKRPIVYFKTRELVESASLVLTHASTAINFVVLYRKPFIFLIDDFIKASMVWEYLFQPMINELNIIPFDFGCEGKVEPWNYVNMPSDVYEQYIEHFIKEQITEEGKEDTFFEVVYDYIKG